MRIVRFRLTGDALAVEQVLKAIEAQDDVDRIEEVADQGAHLRDDSSSLGLVDDTAGADFHDVEVHARSAAAAAEVRDRLVLAARSAGVALEFVERF
jgi:hypothetical protein